MLPDWQLVFAPCFVGPRLFPAMAVRSNAPLARRCFSASLSFASTARVCQRSACMLSLMIAPSLSLSREMVAVIEKLKEEVARAKAEAEELKASKGDGQVGSERFLSLLVAHPKWKDHSWGYQGPGLPACAARAQTEAEERKAGKGDRQVRRGVHFFLVSVPHTNRHKTV